MSTACGARPTSIEAALTAIEHAQDNLFGLGNLSDSILNFSTLRDDDGLGALPHHGTPWGVKASQGSRPNMEDAYSVQVPQQSCSPRACGLYPSSDVTAAGVVGQDGGAGLSAPEQDPSAQALSVGVQEPIIAPPIPEDLAVLSVFDGHGGTEVAEHARTRLHMHFAASLSEHRNAAAGSGEAGDSAGHWADPSQPPRCPQHSALPAGDRDCKACALQHVADALRAAFLKTDSELAGTDAGEYVGATAVVAVVGRDHIWIAHCGDSRAVIQRNGESVALTRDHKPDREDEAARIKAAGGRIVFSNGSHRVMGMLAMSRALGDHFLRPYVIADPEVTCVERTMQDEVLVLATDGLWDVFSCKDATTLAQRCITRSKERGMSRHGACRVAASVLTKVALERGSRDNITVIVVDVSMSSNSTNHHHNPAQQHHPHQNTHPHHHSAAASHHQHQQHHPSPAADATSSGGKPPLAPAAGRAQIASGAAAASDEVPSGATATPFANDSTGVDAFNAHGADAKGASASSTPSAPAPPLDPSAAFGTSFSKLQMHASAAAAGLAAPIVKSNGSPSTTLAQAPAAARAGGAGGASDKATGVASSRHDSASAATAASAAPSLVRQSMGEVGSSSSSNDSKAAAGGSAGSKGSAGGLGSRSQGFSVTTCTWVKGGSSTSLNTLANSSGSGPVNQLPAIPLADRSVDRQTSLPSQSEKGNMGGPERSYMSSTHVPGEGVSVEGLAGGASQQQGSVGSLPAAGGSTGGGGLHKPTPASPRGTIGATHRLAVAASHGATSAADGAAAQPQSAIVRALKAEQQEGSGAPRPLLPPAHAGSRGVVDALAGSAARNASENGAVSAGLTAARKPRVLAKRPEGGVQRKTSSLLGEGTQGPASAPAAGGSDSALAADAAAESLESKQQRSSDQSVCVCVDGPGEPAPSGYKTF